MQTFVLFIPSALVWAGRAAWAALPLTAGPVLGTALRDWEPAARTTASAGLWLLWLLTLIATLVPHPAALTTWRVLAPAAAGWVAWAALDGEPSLAATLNIAVLVGCAFAPSTASVFVNGPAYPNERRFPLRPPAAALVGPAAGAWLVLVGAPTAAALLLASGEWVAGVVIALIGAAGAAVSGRALHGLARRWLVVVPAGLVLHDPLTLADPVLLQRATIAGVGPALADADGPRLDLTAGALGLAVELRLAEPTSMLVVTRHGRRRTAETVSVTRVLVAPTRAAAVLAEVARRAYRVG